MYIRIAYREAAKSRHHQHKLGAVLVKGGKPIAVAHNFSHVHAEHACLNQAWRSDVDGATMVVVRVRKNGTIGMARPCALCMKRLIQAGIKKVLFTNESGKLEIIRLPRSNNVATAISPAWMLPYGNRSE